MPPFRPLDQHRLDALDDDALIAYMREAGAAGDESAGLALGILVYGQRGNVRRRVLMKVPPQDVDDVTDEILEKAIVSAFDGSSGAQFGAWLNTIAKRAIADYHRRGPGRLDTEPLQERDAEAPAEHAVELEDAVGRVLATFNEKHRRVIGLWLRGVPAPEIDGVSAANVHQIVLRFRRALRGQLGEDPKGEVT